MGLYLANYTLKKHEYMHDVTQNKREQKSMMIEADNEDLAEKTLEKYWDEKSDQYGTSYDVESVEIVQTIRQQDILYRSH